MSDVLTIEDLQTAKKHDTFHSEVITGKAGGLSAGADIDYATNQVTGQVQKTLPKVLRDLGMMVQTWTATTGGTLTDASQVFLNDITASVGKGNYYAWTGTFPKVVAPGADPAAVAGFVMRSDAWLRSELAENTVVTIQGEVVPTSRICVHNFGSNNSPAAWVAAMQYCASNGYTLHVDGNVALTDIAKYVMPDNTRLVIDWTGCTGFSVLDSGDWEKLVITSEKYCQTDGCYVEFIGNPVFTGTGVAHWGESNYGMRKNIPVRIQANTVKIDGYDVRSVWGIGLRLFNVRDVEINSFNAEEVGGHSTTYVPDDFGDGIYFGGLTGDVQIKIGLRRITGMLGSEASTVSKGLSRIGIAFENSTNIGAGNVTLSLIGGSVSNFERTIHAEGIGNLAVLWDGSPVIKNAGVLLHRYNPVGAEGKVTYATINDAEYYQKENHRFGSDYGIGGGCYATLNGGAFYGIGRPFDIDTDVNQSPSAANWTFNGSDLYLNNSRLQFRLGSCAVTGGRIFDHGAQQQNAEGSRVTFKNVNFDISMPALNGVQISPAGKDAFINCVLNNQTFARANAFDQCVFRNDNGISASGGTRVTSYTQKLPKIPMSLYRITSTDTAAVATSAILENGSITGGKLVDNGDGTVSLHSSVLLHAAVEITWFK